MSELTFKFSAKDLDSLAELVAEKISARLPRSESVVSEYLGRTELAKYLGFASKSSSFDKLLKDPSFPKRIDLFPGCRGRWRRSDVERFAEAKRLEIIRLQRLAQESR